MDILFKDVDHETDNDDIDVFEVDVKVTGEEVGIKLERQRWPQVWNFLTLNLCNISFEICSLA